MSGGMAIFWQLTALATQSVTLGWEPSVDPNVAGYNIYYGTASHVYVNKVSPGNVTNATISGLVEGTTYFFAATTSDVSGEESAFSNEASYAVPLAVNVPPPAKNQPPTLNAMGNVGFNENCAAQTMVINGITSGALNEKQTLSVTASSSNPSLIPNPLVSYTSPKQVGTLTLAPAANASGNALITVTVNDGGPTNNLVQKTFMVIVNHVNQPPTLDPIATVNLNENDGGQSVDLTGISSGAPNENQTLTVTASSSNPALIPNPTVHYSSPNAGGTLTFKPAANASGGAVITVLVNDGGNGNNLVRKSFTVIVSPVNQPPTLNAIGNVSLNENCAAQTMVINGITAGAPNERQRLAVTASSSNPSLIPNPLVSYTSPNQSGTLTFKPLANATGSATISVSVNDGTPSNNIITKTFNVTVNDTTAANNATPATSPDLTVAKTTTAQIKTYANPTDNFTVAPTSPATLTQAVYANGQYAFYVSGTPGSQYVVQASTNLVDWVSVETNTAPFTFVDVNAAQYTHQFYRAVGQ